VLHVNSLILSQLKNRRTNTHTHKHSRTLLRRGHGYGDLHPRSLHLVGYASLPLSRLRLLAFFLPFLSCGASKTPILSSCSGSDLHASCLCFPRSRNLIRFRKTSRMEKEMANATRRYGSCPLNEYRNRFQWENRSVFESVRERFELP
jgi:hypothetical protein